MRVKWKVVSVFLAGVVFGMVVSLLNFLTIVDITGYPRNYTVSYHELVNMELLRHVNGTRNENKLMGLRVTCWVLTVKAHHKTKALAVKNTWGRRCDNLVFISSENDATLGAVRVGVPGGWAYLWGKTKAGLRYVHEHHLNDSEWFIKADDDTYVIMENLRFMLASRNSSDLVYLGYRFKKLIDQGYMSGGAGYVLSRAALRLVVEKGLTNESLCSPAVKGSEDLFIGHCLQNLGIPAGDSRDEFGRDRFFPLPMQEFVSPVPDNDMWIWQYAYYKITSGLECCSDSAVAFHYIDPWEMYAYEYFLYYLRVHRTGPALGRTQFAVTLPEVTIQMSDLLEPSELTALEPSAVTTRLEEVTVQPSDVRFVLDEVTVRTTAVYFQKYEVTRQPSDVKLQPSKVTAQLS